MLMLNLLFHVILSESPSDACSALQEHKKELERLLAR